jgi:hypothetical protein
VGQGWTPKGFELIVTSRGGFSYDVERSSDLVNWFKVKTLAQVNGSIQVHDDTARFNIFNFYRAKQLVVSHSATVPVFSYDFKSEPLGSSPSDAHVRFD